MDEFKMMPAFSRTRKKPAPKGVISINRKKPKIEKYDNSPLTFSSEFVYINDKPLETPPMEE